MGVEEIIGLLKDNGMAFVLMGYFLFKDYKFNEQTISVLTEIREVLSSLNAWHTKEEK